MFAENHSSGKHMVCDIRNIQNTVLLNNKDQLKNLLKTICSVFDYKILGDLDHIFNPQGCTLLFLLSESHMSIHTFPEKNYLAFDLYTCRQYKDNTDYMKIYSYLIEQLQGGSQSSYTILDRIFSTK
jgi:S-adenosylmethionine decarboxylase proenzyme